MKFFTNKSDRRPLKGRRSDWVPLRDLKPFVLDVDPSEGTKVSEEKMRERQMSGPVRVRPQVP